MFGADLKYVDDLPSQVTASVAGKECHLADSNFVRADLDLSTVECDQRSNSNANFSRELSASHERVICPCFSRASQIRRESLLLQRT